MEKGEAEEKRPIFRDIRRYYCEYCGICRSKKALIASHVLAEHKDEMERDKGGEEVEVKKSNTCEVCGASFKKPAYLKQHMLSHSLEELGCLRTRSCEALDPTKELQNARGYGLEWTSTRGETSCEAPSSGPQSRCVTFERSYVCTIDDCRSTYRRKDHLNRHLLQHQGKLFKCPIENCKSEFSFQGNVKRHVVEFHSEDCPSTSDIGQKQHVCQEPGCGKAFPFASKLRKHEDSHVKLDSVEAFCSEPDCMKYFSNKQCLQDHIQSCHTHITCEICGKKEWKKNIKSHLRTHEEGASSLEIKCDYEGCLHTFSKKSNLLQHVKALHLQQKPFACSFSGCGKTFSYKHVRDKHEKSGCHVYTYGDFEEADEQFRSRARGGRKRMCPTVEMLVRKRVSPPDQFGPETEFLSQFFSQEEEDEQ
ncbi:transcription factor IIIA isoform X1 [Argentina anserina]|uniref:transcription factor IIIA isoform X1 n=1 Tax=Argentina anserina TaxID=57926 RepID=UPI0021765A3B|nr:transcription factor IIIA isoform X1 [Potentilla anserina]